MKNEIYLQFKMNIPVLIYLQILYNSRNIRSIIEFNQNELVKMKTPNGILYGPNSNLYEALAPYINKPNKNIRDQIVNIILD